MITLNAADEPDPARGFVADWPVWPTNRAAGQPLPYLYDVRDDTVPLPNLSPFTSSVASGGWHNHTQTVTWPPASA